VVLTKP
jgi:hypothetical protein